MIRTASAPLSFAGDTWSAYPLAAGPPPSLPGNVASRPDRRHAEPGPKTVLLVDDDNILREIVRITLGSLDCRVLESADGEACLEVARVAQPDLILLDWMLPSRTGIEVAEALGRDPATADIPIVMLTSRDEASDIARGRQAGVRSYLVKPFSPLELLHTVEEILS